MARGRSMAAPLLVLGLVALLGFSGRTFVAPSARSAAAPSSAQLEQTWLAVGGAALVASVPAPAYAGGMFDFGLTLPFVAVTFLLMMVVLNALWYAPVQAEIDDRNAKLLQTLSEATDMLAKADEIQVEYTEQIRAAREKATAAVNAYKRKTEEAIELQISAATAQRNQKAAEVKARLDADVDAKIKAAEAEIVKRKAAFVKATLAKVSL